MATIIQEIQDGRVIGDTSAAKAENGQAKTKSTMNENKEMFLKLLVTEMQYQDPMQPKDNSEYVKELSQFTQVETLNTIQDDIQKLTANTLPGKYVSIDNDGVTVDGKVDYVTTQSGTTYVSVNGNLYKVGDITSVSETDYFEDTTMAENVEQLINQLPDPERLTLQDEKQVAQVDTAMAGLSQTALGYVSQEAKDRFESIWTKMTEMIAAAQEIETKKVVQEAVSNALAGAAEGYLDEDEEFTIEEV